MNTIVLDPKKTYILKETLRLNEKGEIENPEAIIELDQEKEKASD